MVFIELLFARAAVAFYVEIITFVKSEGTSKVSLVDKVKLLVRFFFALHN